VWASAKVPSLDMEYWENGDDSIVAYMKLFNYIRGANDRSEFYCESGNLSEFL